ncbi:MAG: SDR family oxidoreductase [Pseudomonadota bacterium]
MKAILTGHTRGLGAALAHELLSRGIPVLGLARGDAATLQSSFPALLTQVKLDLSDGAALSAWLSGDALRDYLAGCATSLLLNNAGTVQPMGALAGQDPDAIARAIALNVAAPLMLTAAVVRASPGAQQRIVHVSSGAGRSAYPGWSVYCATKAALDQHASAAALDATPGLRICSLAPGVIDTPMQAEIRATSASQFPLRERFVELKRSGALRTPAACAAQLIDYLLGADFGKRPVHDLRN